MSNRKISTGREASDFVSEDIPSTLRWDVGRINFPIAELETIVLSNRQADASTRVHESARASYLSSAGGKQCSV